MEPILAHDKFVLEDIKLMLGMVGIIEERLTSPCYKQDFTISHILQTASANLKGVSEMIAMRLLGDQHE
jgi:hypothetical protein